MMWLEEWLPLIVTGGGILTFLFGLGQAARDRPIVSMVLFGSALVAFVLVIE